MGAKSSATSLRVKASCEVQRVVALAALGTLAICATSFAEEPATEHAQEQTSALWKEQELDFYYHSSTAIYSCDALQGRVVSILRAVGASEDLQVTVYECSIFPMQAEGLASEALGASIGGIQHQRVDHRQFAHVHIRVKSPVVVTPELLAELDKDKGRRELAARVSGNRAAADEATAQFPAHWQPVSLSRRSLGLAPEECELVEQMNFSVLPKLSVRVVKNHLMCMPHEVSMLQPQLQVEALVKTPLMPVEAKPIPTSAPAPAEAKAPEETPVADH
jgi:hypothetical protein